MSKQAYPKPGPTGGWLIREVISFLRGQGVGLPLFTKGSHILIAVSGGADSTALAHLLSHYGRRVVEPERLVLLHINHGWRGEESEKDAEFVHACAKRWGVRFQLEQARELPSEGESWESHGRTLRQRVFGNQLGPVLTAHHADDQAETVLWRILTGSASTHGGGIAAAQGRELRPLLRVRRALLRKYLLEEGESWREDQTNSEGRFLRSQMRQTLMPELERLFPKAVERLGALALEAQRRVEGSESEELPLEQLIGASGLRLCKAQWEGVASLRSGRVTQLQLPQGWRLERSTSAEGTARWVLQQGKD